MLGIIARDESGGRGDGDGTRRHVQEVTFTVEVVPWALRWYFGVPD